MTLALSAREWQRNRSGSWGPGHRRAGFAGTAGAVRRGQRTGHQTL